MKRHSDILIIGGGISGLACAHYLNREGASVRIIEGDRVGAAASHGNCGILAFNHLVPVCAPGEVESSLRRMARPGSPLRIPFPQTPERLFWLSRFAAHCNPDHLRHAMAALFSLIRLSQGLFSDLMAAHGFDCGYSENGMLVACENEEQIDSAGSGNPILEPFGFAQKRLAADELKRRAPVLKPELAGGWHLPQDRHLRPDQLIREWKRYLLGKGIDILEGCPVQDIRTKGGEIRRAETPRGGFSAGTYVLAAGAWSRAIASRLNIRLPIEPGRGYSITFDRPLPGIHMPVRFEREKILITPWRDGFRIGGMMEFSGPGLRMNPRRFGHLRRVAEKYIGPLPQRPLGAQWAGPRPMMYDDLPVIDRSATCPNLCIAAGHGMLGLTLAPATGRLIARMVTGQQPDVAMSPFRLDRFGRPWNLP